MQSSLPIFYCWCLMTYLSILSSLFGFLNRSLNVENFHLLSFLIRMFMTGDYSTIGFYDMELKPLSGLLILQNKLFLCLPRHKAVKLRTGYLMNSTVLQLFTNRSNFQIPTLYFRLKGILF